MKKDPNILGQYLGNGQYSSSYRKPRVSNSPSLPRPTNPERNAKIRDLLFGVAEIISGAVCFYIGPPPWKYAGPYMIVEGGNRVWDAINGIWLMDNITRTQFQAVNQELKTVSQN